MNRLATPPLLKSTKYFYAKNHSYFDDLVMETEFGITIVQRQKFKGEIVFSFYLIYIATLPSGIIACLKSA